MITPEHEYQVCHLNEGMKKRIFGAGKEGIAKTFMEGLGLPWEEKFECPIKVFEGCFNIFSFNGLPDVLKEAGPFYETDEDRNEREAYVNRCVYHYMDKTYPSKLDSFPYKSHQLAKWFHKRWLEIIAEKADDDLIELGKR